MASRLPYLHGVHIIWPLAASLALLLAPPIVSTAEPCLPPPCSLAPGDDPTFLAQHPASAKLTPELAAQLQALLREGLEEDCPVW